MLSESETSPKMLLAGRSFGHYVPLRMTKSATGYAEKRHIHWPTVILSFSEESPSKMLLGEILRSFLETSFEDDTY